MWAIVPAAGLGQRIQPIACSKELLPVGHRRVGPARRPKAVSEYLLDRLILAGAQRLCFVISAGKTDIMQYFGERFRGVPICYVVQSEPRGLSDAIFRAAPFAGGTDRVLFGLPDTIWFPEDALCRLPRDASSLLLFPVDQPRYFDAVLTDETDRVTEVEVKVPEPRSSWIWGAGCFTAAAFARLHELWHERERRDEYLGTLLNAFIAEGGDVRGVRAGHTYLDVGTYEGFQSAAARLNRTRVHA